MTNTTLPARTTNGQPNGRAVRLRATVPGATMLRAIDPDATLPFVVRKGNRLMTNGYRFTHRDGESYTCTGPDGQAYIVNLAAGYCTCPATARCSHMVAAERIARICATHDCRPEAHWFDHECADCGSPAWSYVRTGSYGRSWRTSVCPCGCESRTMEVAR